MGGGGCLYRCWGQGLSVQVGGAVYGMVVVAVFLGLLEMGWGGGGGEGIVQRRVNSFHEDLFLLKLSPL